MNREKSVPLYTVISIPHTRGDEPIQLWHKMYTNEVFPTHVGMNRE